MPDEPTPKWLYIMFLLTFLFTWALLLPLGVWTAFGATLLGLAGPLAGQGSRGYRRIRSHRSPSR